MEALSALLTWITTWPADHPVMALVIGSVGTYLGSRAVTVIHFILFLLRTAQDRMLDDTEVAELLWRFFALVYGWLPGKSEKGLTKYSPEHWHPVILEGKSPDFKLVRVPIDKVGEVESLLEGG